jgi:cytochrome c peroxidase
MSKEPSSERDTRRLGRARGALSLGLVVGIVASSATVAGVVSGQGSPAGDVAPSGRSAGPTSATAKPPAPNAANPGVTAPASQPDTSAPGASIGPVSGGGNAPHGALPMSAQLTQISAWARPLPASAAPAGVEPSFWKSIVPADNAGNDARIALGKKLYFEPKLSKDGTVACATCHDVSRGLTDRRGTSEGIRDKVGQRNAPTTMNAAFYQAQFWDGRATTLEDQAKLPVTNPIEMGQPDGNAAIAAIKADPEYQRAFQSAYGHPVNFDDAARAIATFERTLIFLDAPFDRFMGGDTHAVDDDAKAGWVLFNGKARCSSCHQINSSSPIGTDNRFHNIGVSARHKDFEGLAKKGLEVLAKDSSKEAIDHLALETDLAELGRFVVSRNRADIGAFKTSQVRNVGVTTPYMHDGSIATLWDVIDHYNKGGEANPYLDGGIEPLALSEREIDQLVAFLFALTDGRLDADNRAEMARQKQLAIARRPLRDDAVANRKILLFERRAAGQR